MAFFHNIFCPYPGGPLQLQLIREMSGLLREILLFRLAVHCKINGHSTKYAGIKTDTVVLLL